jgi:hypothetical protein
MLTDISEVRIASIIRMMSSVRYYPENIRPLMKETNKAVPMLKLLDVCS